MNSSSKACAMASMAIIALASLWNCGVAAFALTSLLEPIPRGAMLLDVVPEIVLISSVLSYSLPLFFVCLSGGIFCTVRWKISCLPLAVASVCFIGSLLPALAVWRCLVLSHGPEVNLWSNHIWWHIGG